jgi:hypothetical protein
MSDTWCLSAVEYEPYFFISLANLTYLTRLHIRSVSSNIDFYLHYSRTSIIDRSTVWHAYQLLSNHHETIVFDPPIIAKHVRFNFKGHSTSICFRMELFGCVFTDGVVSYRMLQGAHRLEDETYDGQYDSSQHVLHGMCQLFD